MVDESQVIIPQEAVDINELVNKSEMCIGLNGTMMTLPGNVITGCSQQFPMSYTPLPQLSYSQPKPPAPPSGTVLVTLHKPATDKTVQWDDAQGMARDFIAMLRPVLKDETPSPQAIKEILRDLYKSDNSQLKRHWGQYDDALL